MKANRNSNVYILAVKAAQASKAAHTSARATAEAIAAVTPEERPQAMWDCAAAVAATYGATLAPELSQRGRPVIVEKNGSTAAQQCANHIFTLAGKILAGTIDNAPKAKADAEETADAAHGDKVRRVLDQVLSDKWTWAEVRRLHKALGKALEQADAE